MMQPNLDLASYDHVILFFSGGKESLASLLYLLEAGVEKSRIELWHHDIDGREGNHFMDWPVTPAYCEAIAKAFEIPLYFSWRQERFLGKNTLVISGERAEESPARSRYKVFEPDRSCSLRRRAVRLRPVHAYKEADVWEIIARHGVNPHPAYHLGYGRTSCLFCIFGSTNQWASARTICPAGFGRIGKFESEFGFTINRSRSVIEMADSGNPYSVLTPSLIDLAMSRTYSEPIFLDRWHSPAGAYGEAAGPS